MCYPLASSSCLQESMSVTGTGNGGGLKRPTSASLFMPAGLPRPRSAPDITSLTLQASSGKSSPAPQRLASKVKSGAVALPSASPKTWRILWCHERCHKPDNEGRRAQLNEVTRTAGASLVCLKKASKYGDWLRKGQRPPYILLTDWREVKPCLGIASQVMLSNQPTFTVVLCEEQSHFDRAHAWAGALPRRADPVHVCKDLNFLKAFLNKYSARMASGGPTSPQQPSLATDPAAHQQNLQPNCQDHGMLLATVPRLQQLLQVPWCQTAGEFISTAMMAPGAAAFPRPITLPAISPGQLEWLLQAAAPDTYED